MFGSRSCSASHDRLDREVVGVKARSASQRLPQDAGILVVHRHHRPLPAQALVQGERPLRDAVLPLVGRHHGRLRTLDEQGAQVGVQPEPAAHCRCAELNGLSACQPVGRGGLVGRSSPLGLAQALRQGPGPQKQPKPPVKRLHDPKKPHVALSRLLAAQKVAVP